MKHGTQYVCVCELVLDPVGVGVTDLSLLTTHLWFQRLRRRPGLFSTLVITQVNGQLLVHMFHYNTTKLRLQPYSHR